MNKSDSERLAAVLEKQNYSQAPSMDRADLVVINMCSVRQSAVDRVFGVSQKLAKLKVKNPKLKTALTGCILISDKKRFAGKFDSIWDNKKFSEIPAKYQANGSALIPISHGCDNACAYCAVPFTRGKLVCRDHKKILEEIENAVGNGAREIWLLGQNVNNYRSQGINFAKLIKMANDIPGKFSIRFMSPHPKDFSDELIGAMANCRKITHYLNLPLQSGDNRILRKMGRPYTVEQYKNLVKKIRRKIPDINLSTDIIVGFPGETKKQFENSVKLFREIKFGMAYISRYSPRPGTLAAKMNDTVSPKEKKRRWKILNNIILKKNEPQSDT